MAAPTPTPKSDVSRMAAVYGDALAKLARMDVLIVGMGGAGVETAKNILLATPHSLTVYDPVLVTEADFGSNFFIRPSSVGARRDVATVPGLQLLNDVPVRILEGGATKSTLDISALSRFHAVVFTDNRPLKELAAYDDFCRSTPQPSSLEADHLAPSARPTIVFLAGGVLGLAAYAFADFGPSHRISDPDGEAEVLVALTGIKVSTASVPAPAHTTLGRTPSQQSESGGHLEPRAPLVLELTADRVLAGSLSEDAYVALSDTGNWSSQLLSVPRKVLRIKGLTMTLEANAADDFASLPPHEGSAGYVRTVKMPSVIAHSALSNTLTSKPPPSVGDSMGTQHQALTMALLVGLDTWRAAHGGALPPLRDPAAAEEVVSEARAAGARLGLEGPFGAPFVLPEDEVRTLAGLASVSLPALETLVGALLAQELVKVTGKFTPISQWFAFSDSSVLPPWASVPSPSRTAALETTPPPASDCPALDEFAPSGSRDDALVAIFGRRFQRGVVENARVFLVGAGALGCEYMKQFALTNVGVGPRGLITVTDMDKIEASNLSRQMLFRGEDVNKFKSACSGEAVAVVNPAIRVRALVSHVGPDTDVAPFDDGFWRAQDIIVTALDNLAARQYVDRRALWFSLPYVQGGTQGLKGNAAAVSPFQTGNYAETTDATDAIAMCTLRSFPSLPLHCIEWARDTFAGLFTAPFTTAAAIAAEPEAYCKREDKNARRNPGKVLAQLRPALAALELAASATLPSLVAAARAHWQAFFHNVPAQLIFSMPRDYPELDDKGEPTGRAFWSPPKRFPSPLVFDATDPLHLAFIRTTVQIIATAISMPLPDGWDSEESLRAAAAAAVVPAFTPKAGVKIATKEDDAGDDSSSAADDGGGAAVKEAFASLLALHAAPASPDAAGSGATTRLAELAVRLQPTAFEKDDDANGHVDFLTTATNLRSKVYSIEPSSRFTVRLTAGRIVPAVATCTAAVTGLGMLELYKLLQGKPLSVLREHTFNMAVNSYEGLGVEPDAPRRDATRTTEERKGGKLYKTRRVVIPAKHSAWDRLVLRNGSLRWVYGPNSSSEPRTATVPVDPSMKDLSDALSALHGSTVVVTSCTLTLHAAAAGKKPKQYVLYDALGGDSDATALSSLYTSAVRAAPQDDPGAASKGYWVAELGARLEPEAPLPDGVDAGPAIVPPLAICFA